MENKTIIVRAFVVGIFLTTLFSKADLPGTRKSKIIAKEKNVIESADILKLETQNRDTAKDWLKLDNKYFTILYPKCFKIEAQGDDENPKITSAIAMQRQTSCSEYKENWGESNSLLIEYTLTKTKDIGNKSTLIGVSPLFRQKAEINKLESYMVAGTKDKYSQESNSYSQYLLWQVIIKCKNKVFLVGFTLPSGQPSLNRMKVNDYSIPEDFKEIISTFQCKK